MSDLARLLRSTKLAQLAKPLGDLEKNISGAFPTHQVVESLPASFKRRDFGLKMRIPTKIKSKYIVVNNLDNKYSLPDFEPLGGFALKKKKFQEFGIPVQVRNSTISQKNGSSPLLPGYNPLQDENSIARELGLLVKRPSSLEFATNKRYIRTLRRPFMEWLAKTYPERVMQADLSKEIVEFLKIHKAKESSLTAKRSKFSNLYRNQFSGTAGLSYNLKGRLFQSPNGVLANKVLPGRYISARSTGSRFALGGFVGNSVTSGLHVKYLNKLADVRRPLDAQGRYAREFTVPLIPKAAHINLIKKKLSFEVEPVRDHEAPKKGGFNTMKRYSPKAPLGGSDKNQLVLSSLLGLLETVGKK
ncbi:hypothetical protein OGAPHI_004628 [Ogataea philodendri]|uniref:Uncharacterized protein n=1 Tax=Ogataea philodendri TaxID=1378263 RepID=A0A9P8T328_9ASCO|nr:uncharacterized protein OGAPHI_004628 [Ogataea philodendri]KAH3664276.1 hypothetical protein OGAPHI_004628 [Ogataea philodendri]